MFCKAQSDGKFLAVAAQPESRRNRQLGAYAGVTRLRRKLDWQLEQLISRPLAKVDSQVLDILRLAVYELTERGMDAHAITRHVDLAALTDNRGCTSFVNGAAP